jgi:hypothetical protein
MSWWVIVLIIIGAFILYDLTVGKKERNQREDQEKQMFRRIAASNQKQREEQLTRLNPADEQISQRIKKLFYSASYHETRNLTAFQNVLKELSQIRQYILQNGGKERMKIITDRVVYLCGNDMRGLYEYLSILTHINESTGTH